MINAKVDGLYGLEAANSSSKDEGDEIERE